MERPCRSLLQSLTFKHSTLGYPLVILLKNDDDDMEDIFESVRGLRERTPLREYPERPELNHGLSGTNLDGQESETEQKSPQFRPFRSKYSIFYPKMCKPDPDENENTGAQTSSQDKNENEREANEDEANNENIEHGQRNENMKEGDIEGNNANDQENMAKPNEN